MIPLHSPLMLCPQRWVSHRETTTHLPALLPGQHSASSAVPTHSVSFSLGVRISISHFFCDFSFMSFFAPLSHLSCLLFGSLCLFPRCSFIVALVITSHIRYVGPRCMACSTVCVHDFTFWKLFLKLSKLYFSYSDGLVSLFRMNHLRSPFWILKTY